MYYVYISTIFFIHDHRCGVSRYGKIISLGPKRSMERRSAKSVSSLSRSAIALFQLIQAAVYRVASSGITSNVTKSFGLRSKESTFIDV